MPSTSAMECICKEFGECLKTRICLSFADVSEKVVGTMEIERRPGLQSFLCTGQVHGRGDIELERRRVIIPGWEGTPGRGRP